MGWRLLFGFEGFLNFNWAHCISFLTALNLGLGAKYCRKIEKITLNEIYRFAHLL